MYDTLILTGHDAFCAAAKRRIPANTSFQSDVQYMILLHVAYFRVSPSGKTYIPANCSRQDPGIWGSLVSPHKKKIVVPSIVGSDLEELAIVLTVVPRIVGTQKSIFTKP